MNQKFDEILNKLLKWTFFGVILAIVPIVFSMLFHRAFSESFGFEKHLSDGELLLITAGLCAAGLGELLGSSDENKSGKITCGGTSVVILLLSAGLYTAFANAEMYKEDFDVDFVLTISCICYVCALVSSTVCILLSD